MVMVEAVAPGTRTTLEVYQQWRKNKIQITGYTMHKLKAPLILAPEIFAITCLMYTPPGFLRCTNV
jgi:hypothetical protein